jgi:DNA mismatch repair protein MutL
MSIQALPPTAVRLIGATQVITDASSLVKELIDNALDARSTSIQIEISANTIDVIQVRDNGHGVTPEDRDLLCKRYCTSKIRDYDDLKELGGSTLGFRGEALASTCEIAGAMQITTRVEGEDVASCMKMTPKGEVASRTRASHPVGTTIKISDLFKSLPVRKQTAVKAAVKMLAKIKSLLQAYALARPTVRFALKVLKSKNEKGNWTYVPANGQPKEDAAFKIVGKECAGQCEWQIMETHGYEVQAFLPRPDAVASRIGGARQFLSIDGRPVSATRGTLRQIVKLFKENLLSSNSSMEGVKDPFLWLNIDCPSGTYDPNIEPAKDNVMFENSSRVLEAFEALLKSCYIPAPKEEEVANHSPPSPIVELPASPGTRDIEEGGHQFVQRSDLRRVSQEHNVYVGPDEECFGARNTFVPTVSIESDENSQPGQSEHIITDPWSIAKSSSSTKLQRTGSARNGQLMTPLHERNDREENSASAAQPVNIPPHPPWQMLTPAASSPLRDKVTEMRRPGTALPFQIIPRRAEFDDDAESVHGATDVLSRIVHEDEGSLFHDDTPHDQQRWRGWSNTADFTTAAQLPPGTQPSPPPRNAFHALQAPMAEASGRPFDTKRRKINRRQVMDDYDEYDTSTPQAEDESRVWFDHLTQAAAGSIATTNGRKRVKKQTSTQDIDIRSAFANAGTVSAPSTSAAISSQAAASRAGAMMKALGAGVTGRGAGIDAPFRPVVPNWRNNPGRHQSICEDSVVGGSVMELDEEDLEERDENMLSTAEIPSFTAASTQASTDDYANPIPSSIAALSTPRRLAACADCCHNPDAGPHSHTPDDNHDKLLQDAGNTNSTIRPQTRPSTNGIKRTRSVANLPLERTPAGQHTQNLVTTLHDIFTASITSTQRTIKRLRHTTAFLPLEVGEPTWGVLEPLRAGDVSTADFALDPEDRTLQGLELQTSLTSPAVGAEEIQRWTEWLGKWIAETYRPCSEQEIQRGRAEEMGKGLFVEEAMLRLQGVDEM